MMSHRNIPRRTILINPRLQVGAALCFTAAILAAAALFAWFFHEYSREIFRVTSLQAHYHFSNPYDIVGGSLVGRLAALSAGGLAVCLSVFFILLAKVTKGVVRLMETFHRSADGDLSTPSGVTGLRDLADLGIKIDAAREASLVLIREAREEVEKLRNSPVSGEEFTRRWSNLKQILRRIAP